MGACFVQLRNDVGYGLADAWDLSEPVFGDEDMKRDRKSDKAVSRPGISLRPIRIAASQGGPLRIFAQSACHLLSVGNRH